MKILFTSLTLDIYMHKMLSSNHAFICFNINKLLLLITGLMTYKTSAITNKQTAIKLNVKHYDGSLKHT